MTALYLEERMLEKSARIIEKTDAGPLIEICIKGTHNDYCGNDLIDYIQSTVKDLKPSAILLNLGDFKYSFGNDIGAILFPFLEGQTLKFRPFCIIASGCTAKSLKSLFEFTKVPDIVNAKYFEDTKDGLEYLRATLKANVGPCTEDVDQENELPC